ncbi:MAG TPA: hypothetical protein VFV67_09365 [Actinophytocola sp.]|uniref:hypothetical protein n=1 Tax=Actinophytocola sp. TaxID=1872138 RepID=UPI002DB950A7|nr:hypothetical protein [Actinophytocola sp.]HEU5470849.1 hypothetical protein [Actinophytocola sp.]
MNRSDGFCVDLAALSGARAGVERLLDELTGAARSVPDCPGPAFGHGELAEAASEFRQRWREGMSELVADGASIQHRLGETISDYRRFDEDAAVVFSRLREHL